METQVTGIYKQQSRQFKLKTKTRQRQVNAIAPNESGDAGQVILNTEREFFQSVAQLIFQKNL